MIICTCVVNQSGEIDICFHCLQDGSMVSPLNFTIEILNEALLGTR